MNTSRHSLKEADMTKIECPTCMLMNSCPNGLTQLSPDERRKLYSTICNYYIQHFTSKKIDPSYYATKILGREVEDCAKVTDEEINKIIAYFYEHTRLISSIFKKFLDERERMSNKKKFEFCITEETFDQQTIKLCVERN